MKRYKTNMGLFMMFPAFVVALVLTYIFVIYGRSNNTVNIINIGIDGIILIYYFVNFTYKVEIDIFGITFYTTFKKYKIKNDELGFVVHSSFLTKFVCKQYKFYMLTTPKGSKVLKDIFRGVGKDE